MKAEVVPLSLRLTVFLVLAAVGPYEKDDIHTPTLTHTQAEASFAALEAGLCCCGCLAFDGCCSTLETAAEAAEVKTWWGFHVPASLWLDRKRFRDYSPSLAILSAQTTRDGAWRAQTCNVVYTLPCVPRSREREKSLAAGRENVSEVKKSEILYRSISLLTSLIINVLDCISTVVEQSKTGRA